VSTIEQLAEIPEETIWLQKQKSVRTRRAYRLDVQHFMKTLGGDALLEWRARLVCSQCGGPPDMVVTGERR
jgi:hypothetical protein